MNGDAMKNFAALISVFSLFVFPCCVSGQAGSPAFEVASVKLNPAGGNRIEASQGRLTVTSATLTTCIKWAYRVQDRQISGATSAVSDLLGSERYDIMAKSAGIVPESQLRLMLQNLLTERFGLAFHQQTKEMQVFALVVDKKGPKLSVSQGEGDGQQQAKSRMMRQWKWTTMKQLADVLSEAMETPVLDETGLPAKYDFSLDLTPYLPANGERPDLSGMMVTALRDQLGLRVESRRGSVEVMVIDRLEKPSAN
jgi:uncharacterized protein (TIGR03435 family)